MEWWDRMALPVKRVWSRFAARHRLQNSGLRKLGREVSTCEYEDVHVMWEMLRRSDTEISRYPPLARRRRDDRRWTGWAAYNHLCGRF
ncbi:hypothetical protein HPP92_012140 [Vanilla planifolia]|uniref:Uncharacterized protein n=1 Tax=Vanilla planifolia TaxID=51239 RepID=A0A835R2P9_VANPL|nr:hypothetical protein HPP92_012494 [Vanilla planifolia]KAG0484056.1 hypothetical protein HPP92_012140 [Vanilla planifolia]